MESKTYHLSDEGDKIVAEEGLKNNKVDKKNEERNIKLYYYSFCWLYANKIQVLNRKRFVGSQFFFYSGPDENLMIEKSASAGVKGRLWIQNNITL